ncbi:hypothetical protein D3C73_502630 [compost metagenome]
MYTATDHELAPVAVDTVKAKWGKLYSKEMQSWEEQPFTLLTFYKYPGLIKEAISTRKAECVFATFFCPRMSTWFANRQVYITYKYSNISFQTIRPTNSSPYSASRQSTVSFAPFQVDNSGIAYCSRSFKFHGWGIHSTFFPLLTREADCVAHQAWSAVKDLMG